MTAIITLYANESVYQASDRLVTTRRPTLDSTGRPQLRPHDPSANKSIIYVGSDCRLLIGYTGLAYVCRVPTDKWLAELIYEGPFPEGFEFKLPPRSRKAMDVIELLRERLVDGVSVSVGGFQRTAFGEIPRLWTVQRGFVWANPSWAVIIPRQCATAATYRLIEDVVNAARPNRYPNALARAIRIIAEQNEGVGRDVMVIRADKQARKFQVGFHVDPESVAAGDAMYSPAAMFPGVTMAPSRISSMQFRRAVGPKSGFSEGPVEDPELDCEFILNVNQPVGNYAAFYEYVRKGPPWLWSAENDN